MHQSTRAGNQNWYQADGLDVGDYGYYLRASRIDQATFNGLPPEAQAVFHVHQSRRYGWSASVKIIVRITEVDVYEGRYAYYIVGCEPLLPKRTSKLLLTQQRPSSQGSPSASARRSAPTTAHNLGLSTLNRDIDWAVVESSTFFLRVQEGEGRGRVPGPKGSSALVRFVSLLHRSQRELFHILFDDLDDILASSFGTRKRHFNQIYPYHRTRRGAGKVTSPGHTALPGDYILYVDDRTRSPYRLRWAHVNTSQPKFGKLYAEKLEVIPHLSSDMARKDNFHKAVHDPSRHHPKMIEIASRDVRAIRARGYSHPSGGITYDSKMSFGPGDRVCYSSDGTQGHRTIGWIVKRSGDEVKVWSPSSNEDWFHDLDDQRNMRSASRAIYIQNVHTDGRVPAHVFSSTLTMSYPNQRGTKIYVILWGTLSRLLGLSRSTRRDAFPHIYEAWVAPEELWAKWKPADAGWFSSRFSLKAKPGAFKDYLVSFGDPAHQRYGTSSGLECRWFSRRNIFLSAAGAREHIETWSKQTYRGRRSSRSDPNGPSVDASWLVIHRYSDELRLRAASSTGRTRSPGHQHRSQGSQDSRGDNENTYSGGRPTSQHIVTEPEHRPYSRNSSQNSRRRYSQNSSQAGLYEAFTGAPNRSRPRESRPMGYAAGNGGAAPTRSSVSYSNGMQTDRSHADRSLPNATSEGAWAYDTSSAPRSLRDLRTGDARPGSVSTISRDASLDREHPYSSRRTTNARRHLRTMHMAHETLKRGWGDTSEEDEAEYYEEEEETGRDELDEDLLGHSGGEGRDEYVGQDEEVLVDENDEEVLVDENGEAVLVDENGEAVVDVDIDENIANERGEGGVEGAETPQGRRSPKGKGRAA